MTDNEKLRQEVAALPAGAENLELIKRLMAKVDGQALAYQKLMDKHCKIVEKLRKMTEQRNLQAFKAVGLESLMMSIQANSETFLTEGGYREWVLRELRPYMDAAGYGRLEE